MVAGAAAAALPAAGCALTPTLLTDAELKARAAEVRAAETAFAATMADRKLDRFAALVAEDAVFVNGGKPLHGRAAIDEYWQRFYSAAAAPFSWAPEIVEVNARGDLGYSEGPVRSPEGTVFARYFSTWRREPDGRWLVVFDNGYEVRGQAKP